MHSVQQNNPALNGDVKNNKNKSTQNPYDRLMYEDNSIEAKFSSVYASINDSFSSGLAGKISNEHVQDSVASQQAQQASKAEQDRIRNDKEQEEEERRKAERKKQEQLDEDQKLAQKQQEQQAEFREGFIDRPSDILAASFASRPVSGNAPSAQGLSEMASGTGSGSGSGFGAGAGTGGGSGFGVDPNSNQAQAAAQMAQVSDPEAEGLRSIEQELTQLQAPELREESSRRLAQTDADEIARLDNRELKRNLDTLAREANVSKISLQMEDNRAEVAARRNAQAIAHLPGSNPATTGLNSLIAPNAAQNTVYSTLGGPVSPLTPGAVTSNSTVAGLTTSTKLDTVGNTNVVADSKAILENTKLNQAAEALSISASKLGAGGESSFGIGNQAVSASAQKVEVEPLPKANDSHTKQLSSQAPKSAEKTETKVEVAQEEAQEHVVNDKAKLGSPIFQKDAFLALQDAAEALSEEAAPANPKTSAFGRGVSPLMAEADALASIDMSAAAKALSRGLQAAVDDLVSAAGGESESSDSADNTSSANKMIAAAARLADSVRHGKQDEAPAVDSEHSAKQKLLRMANEQEQSTHTSAADGVELAMDEFVAKNALDADSKIRQAQSGTSGANAIAQAFMSLHNGIKETMGTGEESQEQNNNQASDHTENSQEKASAALLAAAQDEADGDEFGIIKANNTRAAPPDSAALAAQYGGMTFNESLMFSGAAKLYEDAGTEAQEEAAAIAETKQAEAQAKIKDGADDANAMAASMTGAKEAQEFMQTAATDAQLHAPIHWRDQIDLNAQEIHERVMQMAARNMRHLTVELSPNSLGKMRISIDMSADNEAMSVSLAAADAHTRELLEQALPKLQETLGQQNIATEAQVLALSETTTKVEGEQKTA